MDISNDVILLMIDWLGAVATLCLRGTNKRLSLLVDRYLQRHRWASHAKPFIPKRIDTNFTRAMIQERLERSSIRASHGIILLNTMLATNDFTVQYGLFLSGNAKRVFGLD